LGRRVDARHGRAQPHRERDPVLARRQPGRRRHRASRRRDRDRRDRPGGGHPRVRARPRVRALLPPRHGTQSADRRHRPGPRDRQARRAEPRRQRARLVAAGARIDLHHPTPGGPGSRRAAEPWSARMTRILIVEDEPSLAEPLAFLLEREGYETLVAGDGRTALAEFDAGGIDLVLLDLMLPGLPGTEVCRELRMRSTVPIIMLTAKD